jgi:hypothetical protein
MKPNFALNFTDDSIALLHRTKRGWAEVGSTPFDTDDLPAALAELRSKAEALAPGGITTKLIIPNSQIKYLTLVAPGPDAEARKTQIAAALEGQTPYEVTDLVWDHSGTGETVIVAVLARETLDEAEGFAVSNGFNPVAFAAIPPDDSFGTEPFFGPTSFAETVLKPGQKVERDAAAIRLPETVTPETATPEPTAAAEPEPEPQPEPAPEPQPDIPPAPLPAPLPEVPSQPDAMPEPEPMGVPGGVEEWPDPAPPEIPDAAPNAFAPARAPDTNVTPEPEPAPDPAPDPALATDSPARVEAPVDPAAIAATLSAGDPPAMPSVLDAGIPDPDEAPMAVDVGDDLPGAGDAPRRLVDPSVEDDLPPMPPTAALAAYSNRPGSGIAEAATLPPRPAPVVIEADRGAARSGKGGAERPAGARPAPKFSYETPGEKPPSAASKALRGVTAMVTAPSIPGGRGKAKVATVATAAAGAAAAAGTAAKSAANGATQGTTAAARRPSGLGSRPMPVRGKPRHLGLILTGILLIMLALAAGLSSYYVSWNSNDETAPATAPAEVATGNITAPEGVTTEDFAATEIAPEDEMLADLQDPADFAEGGTADNAAGPDNAALAEAPVDAPLDAAAADTEQAATAEPAPGTIVAGDPAPANAPASDAQDEIFLSAADIPPAPVDAAALAALTAAVDTPPAAQQPPPPFGTVYQFDANGLILPTPDGIATPDGVMLFAGSPTIVPPARPDSVVEAGRAAAAAATPPVAATEGQAPADTAAAATEPEVIVPSDPALADARPQPRPAGLAPAPAPTAESAVDDGASLAPAADSRIAGLRPAPRPQSIVAAAAASAVTPAANPNGSLALIAPEGTVTPIGLAISRRPAERPQDLSRAVEEAVAAAIRLPDPEPEPPAAEEITPETEEEPEIAETAAPRIPSSANVATQATLRNAINLREMNLIGVYGTSSNRYALVRNPNGRYIRVEVGDRLDGGRVAAITASEVRYEKRGRMVVLALPNS